MLMRSCSLKLAVIVGALALGTGPARAGVELPRGLTVEVYVSGEGFDVNESRGARGIPAVSTLAFDQAGALYLARTGRRYSSGAAEDITALYRIPPGGARLTRAGEARYFHGPPLPNPQIGTVRGDRELFVTTFDRDRKIGVLYRMVNGRADLFAGGTPDRGQLPLLRQPEGVAVDPRGGFFVADRARGVIVRLDVAGRVADPRYAVMTRPRVLAVDGEGALWVGADGDAEAPWQQGPGEIWRVGGDGVARLVLRGPMAQAIGVSPGGHLVVADRQAAQVFALAPDGTRVDLARFTQEDAPRSLAFAPVTPATREAGIAGDLFVITISRGAWPLNDVLRISGPLDDLIRERSHAKP
jgi:DNA-binding beta-propeller fold protein YncE